jgi:hypothetical protein
MHMGAINNPQFMMQAPPSQQQIEMMHQMSQKQVSQQMGYPMRHPMHHPGMHQMQPYMMQMQDQSHLLSQQQKLMQQQVGPHAQQMHMRHQSLPKNQQLQQMQQKQYQHDIEKIHEEFSYLCHVEQYTATTSNLESLYTKLKKIHKNKENFLFQQPGQRLKK